MVSLPDKLLHALPKSTVSMLASDTSFREAALFMLNKSIFSKFSGGKTNRTAEVAALEEFFKSNDICQAFTFNAGSYYHDLFEQARSRCMQALEGELQAPLVNMRDAVINGRAGPGSSLGTKQTNFLKKMFESRLSMYESSLYEHFIRNLDPTFECAENLRMKSFGNVVVECARLSFAPKKLEIARVINTEASLNMFYQLGAGRCLEGVLERSFGIDLSEQPRINKAMARAGSIDGSFATIDLKSASDRISMNFVKNFLPRHVFSTLSRLRSKLIEAPSWSKRGKVELHMFSTMGNGFTFPLQTLVFACLTEAALHSCGIKPRESDGTRNYSVFGDDIIIRPAAYETLLALLEYCGFTPNREKSFATGDFRESCGGDFFKGRDVRGVYLKDLSNANHKYSSFNRLARWSAKHNIDLTGVLQCLLGGSEFRPVPLDSADSAGHKVPITLTGDRVQWKGDRCYYTAAEPVPRRLRPRLTSYDNPFAELIVVVGGYARGGFLTERVRQVRYRIRRRYTHSWDWMPQTDLTNPSYFMALAGLDFGK